MRSIRGRLRRFPNRRYACIRRHLFDDQLVVAQDQGLDLGNLGDVGSLAALGLDAGQTDLSGAGEDIVVIGDGIDGHQTDILDILAVELDHLPLTVALPLAGGDGAEVLTVVGDLDLVLGDDAVGVAGLAGLVAQAIDGVGSTSLTSTNF